MTARVLQFQPRPRCAVCGLLVRGPGAHSCYVGIGPTHDQMAEAHRALMAKAEAATGVKAADVARVVESFVNTLSAQMDWPKE